MGRVRVGVIGAGSWTLASHLPNLAKHDDVRFVGVARKGADLLAKVRDQYGFEIASEDYRDVLAAELDVCIVASPSAFHAEHALAAMRAGAHVMCEKPVTIDPSSAWNLARESARLSRAFVVAFGWNYLPMIQAAKEELDRQSIGELEHMSVVMSSPTRELLSNAGAYPGASVEASPEHATWTDPLLSGGGYGQAQLTHALGLALWLTGARAQSGFASMSSPLGASVELHDAVVLNFEGGAIGVLSGASSHKGSNRNKHGLEIRAVGSEGQFLIDVEREAVWIHRRGEDTRLRLESEAGTYNCVGPIEAVLAAARGDNFTNQSPADLGAKVVEALDIAYRSASSGRAESRLIA